MSCFLQTAVEIVIRILCAGVRVVLRTENQEKIEAQLTAKNRHGENLQGAAALQNEAATSRHNSDGRCLHSSSLDCFFHLAKGTTIRDIY